jgi:hypothetical protein
MRLWHLCVAVLALGALMALARAPAIRHGLIVLVAAMGEVAMSVAMGLALFQTIGAASTARGLLDLVKGLAATTLVLLGAPVVMVAWLLLGVWLAQATAR